MNWIYLSPHLDDAILSCGGLIWEQLQLGEQITIFTICAGQPPPGEFSAFAEELHARWGLSHNVVEIRRQEDIDACSILGVDYKHLSILDCIYRRDKSNEILYPSESSIFGEIQPEDGHFLEQIRHEISFYYQKPMQIVFPLALGNHIDHQIIRKLADTDYPHTWFYADFPYVMKVDDHFSRLTHEGYHPVVYPVTRSGVQKWIESVCTYRSQTRTFWNDTKEMEQEISNYHEMHAGICLWRIK